MLKQYRGVFITIGLTVAAAAWAIIVPAQRDGAMIVAGISILAAANTAFLTWPGASQLVEARSRLFMIAGWSICAAVVVGMIAAISLAGAASPEFIRLITGGAVIVGLGGYLVATMPRMVAQVAKSRAAFAATKVGAPRLAFDGIREGLAAPLTVARGLPFLVQLAGPWLVVIVGAAFYIIMASKPAAMDRNAAALAILELLLLLFVVLYVLVPSLLVAWIRWIVDGRSPRYFVAWPDRAAFSVAWRIWISLSVWGAFNRLLVDKVADYAGGLIPSHQAVVTMVVADVLAIAVIMVFSAAALRLPAAALQDNDFTFGVASIRGRQMWPGLPVGLVLSLAPIPLVAWVVSWVLQSGAKPAAVTAEHVLNPSDAVVLICWLLVLLATLVSGATFLTRAYLAAKAPTVIV